VIRFQNLMDMLREVDVVSLHLPAGPETIDMVDASFLASMQPGAILINTARGALIVEEDLVAALNEGSLAGAGIDVFRTEPLPPDHLILDLGGEEYEVAIEFTSDGFIWQDAMGEVSYNRAEP
jgi:D-3-phosphoglycerate dehydrogenase / 2-oxoglutarate reductase